MKRSILLLSVLLLLAGCKSTTITYELSIDIEDDARRNLLVLSSMHVIERRLSSMGEELVNIENETVNEKPRITLKTKNVRAHDFLTQDLTSPFGFRIMQEAPPGEPEVLIVEGHGPFMGTGIESKQVRWLEASEDTLPGKGRVTISFTEEGRELMAKVFKENVDKFIGIFVRDRLMAKLLVETDELKDDIVITEIPTLDLAKIFADDVNVGLHVTFTPVK